ncbi:MAG: metallophosphoesterase [Lachnospiraceae bacterium]|nr:metallophosphoesterase [Lachnospiraceae bacterium]
MIEKILIVSDSHGESHLVRQAIDRERPDMLVHLGDITADACDVENWLNEAKGEPVPAVFLRGNCDNPARKGLREQAVFTLNGHRFFCAHGHLLGVNWGLQKLVYAALEEECGIALFGHTHGPCDEEWMGVRILNPGSIARPRGGSVRGYLVMTFDGEGEYTVERKAL